MVVRVVENHDFGAMAFEHPLYEVEGDPTESIAVGDHNFADTTLSGTVQKGTQAGVFEVDPATNVFDDFVVGVPFTHKCNLPVEVTCVRLLSRGDSAVGDGDRARFPGGRVDAEMPMDVIELVELPCSGQSPHGSNLTLAGPCLVSVHGNLVVAIDLGVFDITHWSLTVHASLNPFQMSVFIYQCFFIRSYGALKKKFIIHKCTFVVDSAFHLYRAAFYQVLQAPARRGKN